MFDPIFGPSEGRSGHPVHVPPFTAGLALAASAAASAAVALPLLRLSLLPLLLFLLLLLLLLLPWLFLLRFSPDTSK